MSDQPSNGANGNGEVAKARSIPETGTYMLPDASLEAWRGGGWRPITTLGTMGQTVYGGWLTSRERNATLAGLRKYETYADLVANISIVSAGIRLFLNLLAGVEWHADADEGSGAKGEQLAEIVEDIIEDMTTPWSLVVQRAALYRFYGYSLQEWTAIKRDDGVIGLLDIESRPQFTIERWDLDLSGTVLGVIQRSPEDLRAIYLPRGKLLYMADQALTDSPDGLGLLRHIARNSAQLERYEQLEGFGFETDLRGIPKITAPITQLQAAIGRVVGNRTITQADVNNALTGVNDFLKNHIVSPTQGILLDSEPHRTQDATASPSGPPMFNVDLLAGPTKSHADIAKAIERINRQIARVLGVEHILLGGDGKGSLALSESKARGFADLLDATLREMARAVEKDLLGALWTLNGWDRKIKVKLRPDPVSLRAVEEATKALLDLAQAGATLSPGDPAVNQVRQRLGMEPAPDPIMLDPSAAGPMPSTRAASAKPTSAPDKPVGELETEQGARNAKQELPPGDR